MPSAICSASSVSSSVAPRRARGGSVRDAAHVPPKTGTTIASSHAISAMIELDGRHVAEEILPPGVEQQDLGRHDAAVHQRKRVVGEARPDPGDEAAGKRHHEHERGDGEREAGAPVPGARRRRPRARERRSDSATQSIAAKIMSASPRCAVRRNCETRGSSTSPLLHHVPAHRALQAAEHEDAASFQREPRGMRRARREPRERQQKRGADRAAEQAMEVLPPEDAP